MGGARKHGSKSSLLHINSFSPGTWGWVCRKRGETMLATENKCRENRGYLIGKGIVTSEIALNPQAKNSLTHLTARALLDLAIS